MFGCATGQCTDIIDIGMKLKKYQIVDILTKYLKSPGEHPLKEHEHAVEIMLFLTYMGYAFIEGYRIVERQGCDVFMMSSMEYQGKKNSKHAHYRLVCFQFDSQFEQGQYRANLYQRLIDFLQYFQGKKQVHFCWLPNGKYSVITEEQLRDNFWPDFPQHFYKKVDFLNPLNGYRNIHQKIQGTLLHSLAEIFIKGECLPRNKKVVGRIQGSNRFNYDLYKVLYTICLIVGRQVLENDYQTISVEKWMRKATWKSFKRLDLILRSQEKCCVIDWKFSRLPADIKINRDKKSRYKNKVYYQLTYKDYLTKQVELKFYCIHRHKSSPNHHSFTTSCYFHQIDEVELYEDDLISAESEDSLILYEENFQLTDQEKQSRVLPNILPMDRLKPISEDFIQRTYLNYVKGKHNGKRLKQNQHESKDKLQEQQQQSQPSKFTLKEASQHLARQSSSLRKPLDADQKGNQNQNLQQRVNKSTQNGNLSKLAPMNRYLSEVEAHKLYERLQSMREVIRIESSVGQAISICSSDSEIEVIDQKQFDQNTLRKRARASYTNQEQEPTTTKKQKMD